MTTKNIKNSAVIVLLDLSSDSLILTKRADHLSSHPGEVCFPGGFWEEGDRDLFHTALRELNEELGVESDRVTLIKQLKMVHTLRDVLIHPWLAEIPNIEPYKLNTQEVMHILSIPMKSVQNPKNYVPYLYQHKAFSFKSIRFSASDELIWGATVRIMEQFIKK